MVQHGTATPTWPSHFARLNRCRIPLLTGSHSAVEPDEQEDYADDRDENDEKDRRRVQVDVGAEDEVDARIAERSERELTR